MTKSPTCKTKTTKKMTSYIGGTRKKKCNTPYILNTNIKINKKNKKNLQNQINTKTKLNPNKQT